MNEIVTSSGLAHGPTLREWIGFLIGLFTVWAGVSGGLQALKKGASKSLPEEHYVPDEAPLVACEDWNELVIKAGHAVDEVLTALPPGLGKEARQVPCLFHEWGKVNDGYRTLGSYHNFIPGRISNHKGPIVLFLRTIQQSTFERHEDFAGVVKSTYMHELGHHLGWDEVDLANAGLPSGRPPGS